MANNLVIIGSGPAGLTAAIEAARHGIDVTVVDENSRPGGQLFKQIHKFFGSERHMAGIRGIDIGKKLLAECRELEVKVRLNSIAWGLFNGGSETVQVAVKQENHTLMTIPAGKILLATGARENPLAFPGWTLPGVLGAGAAQTLINLHRIRPGKKVLMIGSGNVGLIVSYQLLQAGTDVAAIIDIMPHIGGWGVHAGKVRRAGVPILTSHTIIKACGDEKVDGALIAEVDSNKEIILGSERMIDIDTICLAVGLSPMSELAWSSSCRFTYIPELGGHVPIHNRKMETSQKGIYVAGDIAGIEEASTAMEEGRIAGIAIAESLGSIKKEKAEKLIKSIETDLIALRRGPMGKSRKLAKEKILQLVDNCPGNSRDATFNVKGF